MHAYIYISQQNQNLHPIRHAQENLIKQQLENKIVYMSEHSHVFKFKRITLNKIRI